MEYTTNLNLKKPATTDNVKISDINENMDTLDSNIKSINENMDTLDSSVKSISINMACGKTSIAAPSGGGTSNVRIEFGKTFTGVPQVMATVQTSDPVKCSCSVGNVDQTGFTLYFYRNGETLTGVSWIAIYSA